jgi:hypothetical protein
MSLNDTIRTCFIELLNNPEVKSELKQFVAPYIYIGIEQIFPYIYLSMLLVFVCFILLASIFVILLKRHT